jgi:hypothetical protein
MPFPARFGHVRAPVATYHAGNAIIAVGQRILRDTVEKPWKSFHDFLFNYLGSLIEQEWFRTEAAKPVQQRHPIMQWYQVLDDLGTWRAHPRGKLRHVATPPALVTALLSLCYELYLLEHHALLRPSLLARVKRLEHFQGARYEVYVATAFLRAGFDVELEDEDDRTISHHEFTVTHRASGRKYSVEAKSRQRTGYLGAAGKRPPMDEIEANCSDLVVKALRKNARHDRIIFVDVNVPPSESAVLESDWLKKVAYQVDRLEKTPPHGDPLPPAIVFFTNFPHHYLEGDQPLRGQGVMFTALGMPEFHGNTKDDGMVRIMHAPILTLLDSMLHHTEIPHDFG